MSQPVIALYKPFEGQEQALLQLVREHHGILRTQNLVTDRPPYVLQSTDGTLLEIFEWKDASAIEAAHQNPTVAALWQRFGKVAQYIPLKDLPEAQGIFPSFTHVDIT